MHALDTSDRLLAAGIALVAVGVGWVLHPGLALVVAGLGLGGFGVLAALNERGA